MATATVIVPSTHRGSVRPFGYKYEGSVSGTNAVYIEVPTDVHQIGLQVSAVTTGYFLEATMNDVATVAADPTTATWFDLLGNGTDAQTAAKQVSIDGSPEVIRIRGSAGGAAATLNATFRRV